MALFTQKNDDIQKGQGGSMFVLVQDHVMVAIGHDPHKPHLHMYHLVLHNGMPPNPGGFMGEWCRVL